MSQVFDNVYSTIVLTSTVGGRKIYKGQVLKWESVLVSFGDFWCQFPLLYNTIVSCFFLVTITLLRSLIWVHGPNQGLILVILKSLSVAWDFEPLDLLMCCRKSIFLQ